MDSAATAATAAENHHDPAPPVDVATKHGELHVITYRAQENYIKAIFQLAIQNSQRTVPETLTAVNPHTLAARLNVNVSAVYLMLKRLERRDWLCYQPYKGIVLTAAGRSLALQLLRRHRLWESFLQEKLGFDWSEVHSLAEELEHVDNDELITRLEKFLDFPTQDPHGDPIPNSAGEITASQDGAVKLVELTAGESGTLQRVLESNHQFLRYLATMQLKLGTTITMGEQSQFDSSYRVAVAGNQHIYLSAKAANALLVKRNQPQP